MIGKNYCESVKSFDTKYFGFGNVNWSLAWWLVLFDTTLETCQRTLHKEERSSTKIDLIIRTLILILVSPIAETPDILYHSVGLCLPILLHLMRSKKSFAPETTVDWWRSQCAHTLTFIPNDNVIDCWITNSTSSGGSRISPGGAPTPGGDPRYEFAKFSQKLHEIETIWVPRGVLNWQSRWMRYGCDIKSR